MPEEEVVPGSRESVHQFYRSVLEPGRGRVVDAREHRCSPEGARAVVTAGVGQGLDGRPQQRVYLLDLSSGELSPLAPDLPGVQRLGCWSRDGARVAFLADGGSGLFSVQVVAADGSEGPRQLPLTGHSAESVEWLPDGRGVLVVAAEEGASAGVLSGSGRVQPKDQRREPWEPSVHRSDVGLVGWRRAFILDASGAGPVRQASPDGINVWEVCRAGEELAAVVSAKPFEGDWVGSWVGRGGPDREAWRALYRPQNQLGCLVASADGSRLAVIEGIASDRGLVAGEVVLLEEGSEPRRLDTSGVDATWIEFRGRDRLAVAGLRGSRTVILELDLAGGALVSRFELPGTTSDHFNPRAAVHPGGGLLLTAAAWRTPPAICLLEGGRLREIRSLADPGGDWLRQRLGEIREVSWVAPDGNEISGLFAVPAAGEAPYPTVLNVHGGPAACWRPVWPVPEELSAALLVACGMALFLPNPRGSSGRGQEFLALELGDYGGGETEDLLSGLDHLVAAGLADPERLAVYGVSHGGYMSCWITTRTDRFRAAVAGSPVTDWYSQHFGSNIPDFDVMFLRADPLRAGGAHYERSPVFFAHRSKTPTLLSAGLQDRCTPPGQAEEFHQALAAAGVETELVIYPEEGHGIRQIPAMIDFGTRMSGLFGRELLGQRPSER